MLTICGADVRTPAQAAELADAIAQINRDLLGSIDQTRSNQTAQGVTGEPVDLLAAMHEAATRLAARGDAAAARFDAHDQKFADTIGADATLVRTQGGCYGDRTAI